jgi:hypothetical protein
MQLWVSIMMETESKSSKTDSLGQIMALLLVIYGVTWTSEGYIEGGMIDVWGVPFVLLGLLWLVVRIESVRMFFSILGLIGGFFGASYWGYYYGMFQYAWVCAALSIVVFTLSGAMLCNLVCTWPDYKWTGGS